MAIHIVEEANRCLGCKKPRCQMNCPIHTPVPEIIKLFKDGAIEEAGERLFENNPFSVVCSMVCNHQVQCEGNCVLGRKGSPVHFSSIETFISDLHLDRMRPVRTQSNGRMVAVIGAGPAGMTVALKLAQAGYDVTIFDSKNKMGGVLRYGIPEFRLPNSIIDRLSVRLEEFGVKFRANTSIGGALAIRDLFRDGYEAVFVGTGVWRPKTLGVRGETLANVHFSVDFLANPAAHALGETVAVIGMGNSAMDVARTALRRGARRVTMYARSKHVSASSDEMSYAQLEGVEFRFGKAISYFTEAGPVFKTAMFDAEDHVVGYEDELDQVHADSTIISISQGPKNRLVTTTDGLQATDKGLLVVDEGYRTTVPGVFAAGDVVTGSKTVVHAVEAAKEAAASMLGYLEERAGENEVARAEACIFEPAHHVHNTEDL